MNYFLIQKTRTMTPQHLTNNITPPNNELTILKAHFPQCFDKNGNFDFEGFKARLQTENPDLQTEKESYSMDWLGKSYARLLGANAATTLLSEDEAHNALPANSTSQNLLLKGDNLEVLKHLTGAYYEKVKMIYIDPPYNTGNDGFVYEDDRKFTVKELQQLAGIDEEKAKRILAFTKSGSNSHSAWLTFMYPRLYIARQLLKEDGVIFISIDDNEVAQLRLLMDEVFGEENFVGESIVVKSKNGIGDKKGFATSHDYLIAYQKSEESVFVGEALTKEEINSYSKKDEFGNYKIDGLLRKKGNASRREDRPNMFYPLFFSPSTGKVSTKSQEGFETAYPKQEDGTEGRWIWKVETCAENIDKLHAGTKGTIYIKNYLTEDKRKKTRSLLDKSEYLNDKATSEIKSVFGIKLFETPKPIKLIQTLVENVCGENDLILDFFAGSGTTGDAVMQLNAEDGGARKFILVQIPQAIDPKGSKAAYDFVKGELKQEPTIFEITKERLIRAAAKIQAEKPEAKGDFGFRVFGTQPIWEDYDFEADDFNPQAELFDETQLLPADIKMLLTTWKTADGLPLTQDLMPANLAGYTAWWGKGKLYLMDKGFTTDGLKALLEKVDSDGAFNITTVVAFGYHFESRHLRELSENLKAYSNRKGAVIDFITRY